ncbi:isoleucyl-tRNA synthetase [Mytilinidion resinicola]|uniref:Isoleucine--tRNA ligase, mitochondrial n=1 Tax=Mytilinidion resinicola TaxID=574789 RepID=A0A6A6Z140_9PEZI|nr:isoleucyl-tRNA synthetase [Mytilinidion resinicola]KAF2814740.1 isoleucyl-tRNA synthetase [Mytilinidion resinicola]
MLTPTRILRAQWTSTLHLPKSTFPARPNPASAPRYLARCTDELYAWQQSTRSLKPDSNFVLHDGPPYANGPLHIGHALNKITKDLICRFEVGQGKRVSYVPGWDCHGLPIELKALQAAKDPGARMSPVRVRKAARALAERTVKEQMAGFKAWGVMGDWSNAYRTMDKAFEMRQLKVFREMVVKGLIYRQFKPVYWSPSSGTALAEAELEYDENHESTAAFIRFPVEASKELQSEFPDITWHELDAVIWTTTPWTLPANTAIAVHNTMEYSVVQGPKSPRRFIIASPRVSYLGSILGVELEIVFSGILGSQIAGNMFYKNPLQGFSSQTQPIIHADFVSDSSGSGLVHMAPGHGMDDYNVCSQFGIQAFAPVDDNGRFTSAAFPDQPELLQGLSVQKEGTNAVLEYLEMEEKEYVLHTHVIKHKYPIDWRTKQPVIIRATEQWFANVDGIKSGAMQALEDVTFIPAVGRTRLESFVQGRSQWCISRQRSWGVPIPALYRMDTEKPDAVMDGPTIDHITKVIEQRGIDAWWTDPEDDPAWIPESLLGTYTRGKDTMDVWFDSGTSWTLLPQRDDGPIADVYFEGTDQHRGWFQSSLLTHVAHQVTPQEHTILPPYRTLITHGFTLDQDGRKMSKSLGNVISPDEIMSGTLLPPMKPRKNKDKNIKFSTTDFKPTYDGMGPDALRLWAASSDYTKDVVIGQPVLLGVNLALHKYRVTFKWLLGVLNLNIPGFSSTSFADFHEGLDDAPLTLADEIALYRLAQVSHEIHAHFAKYEFSRGIVALNKYIVHDLSAFYFETLKDRIYAGTIEDRASAQHVLGLLFHELCQILTPVCPILVEEVWDHVPERLRSDIEHPARIVWEPFEWELEAGEELRLEGQMKVLNAAHAAVKVAQEKARGEKKIGSGLECEVLMVLPDVNMEEFEKLELSNEDLADVFVVSRVSVVGEAGVKAAIGDRELLWRYEEEFQFGEEGPMAKVVVLPPIEHKCPRCWRFVAPQPEELCSRCEDAVEEDKEAEAP